MFVDILLLLLLLLLLVVVEWVDGGNFNTLKIMWLYHQFMF